MKKNFFEKERSLVLGGGAARGLIHLGVYKWLEQKNLQPTEIVGNSMGAIIGSAIAKGLSFEEMYDIATNIHRKDIVELPFGQGAMFSGSKAEQHFLKIFEKEDTFENLPLPFSVIATDINKGEKVVINSGNLLTGVRASMSIPGIFAPVQYDDKLLVDGGLSSNLPVEESTYKNILAVSASHKLKFSSEEKISYNKVLYRSLLSVLHANQKNSLEIVRLQEKSVVYVGPDFDVKFHEFHKVDEMVKIGYQKMKETFE